MKLSFNFLIIIFFLLVGCNQVTDKKFSDSSVSTPIKEFNDDFQNGLKEFWEWEVADSSRVNIVQNPLGENKNVLQVDLEMEDYASGGKRNEVLFFPKDSMGYKVEYGFKFMLPESFFKQDEEPGYIIIHQWHDLPDPGFNWTTQKKSTHPPIYLYVDRKNGDDYDLMFSAGLETGGMDETIKVAWKEKLEPNQWYDFSCEIRWHIHNNKGFAKPRLNGENFINPGNGKTFPIIRRRNMYNSLPNYQKIGLYRFGGEKYKKTIYFDDFYLESYREIDC